MKIYTIFVLMLMLFLPIGCKQEHSDMELAANSLEKINKRGKLVAVTDYNSTSYFLYKGAPMGFQYDLLKQLASSLDLELEVHVTNNLDEAFEMLDRNECDIIAMNLSITNIRKKKMAFTLPITETEQVLVQRKRLAGKPLDPIRNPLDLDGKTIHVIKHSSHYQRLRNLEEETGTNYHLVEKENVDTEQLVAMVASGEIDFTVADKEVALLNQSYYPDLDVETAISFPQKQAWAVNIKNIELKESIDDWFSEFKKTALYTVIYNKYYRNNIAARRLQSPYQSFKGGSISAYDELIKKYAKGISWDWRLLASLIYQESRFDPEIRSWAGAYGLMQLMPETARNFGANEESTPEENIKAGTKFLQWLDNYFAADIPDLNERVKFILASYNAGFGHVQDARRLAESFGANSRIWENNVDFFMQNKSNPDYFNHHSVEFGYCRGDIACNYVKEILNRYEAYQKLIQ